MNLPKKYRLTIIVAPDDGPNSEFADVEFKATYEQIRREDIIQPTYGAGGIAATVELFEKTFMGLVPLRLGKKERA